MMNQDDLQRIESALFFEPPNMRARMTRFVMLILFSSVIAAGGLLSDSVASVIGAMIVAPLMTPIMGMVVAIVIGSQGRLARSALIVLTGITLAIAVGWLMGTFMPMGWEPTTSTQVLSRTEPRLLDLVIALASGGAGAYALSRVDVADALPGVAIAISLVPPLCTVGILLAGGEGDLALGAMVLFLTNMGAILLAGTITFLATGMGTLIGRDLKDLGRSLVAILAFVALIAIPLQANSNLIWADATHEDSVVGIVTTWLEDTDWELDRVEVHGDEVVIMLGGEGELPPTGEVVQEIQDVFDEEITITVRIADVRTQVITSTPEAEP